MNSQQIKIVKEAIEYSEDLSEWEIEFIDNLAEKGDGYDLTIQQEFRLNEIGEKIGAM